MISVVLLGAGNVATHLFKAFNKANEITVNQWYNRDIKRIEAEQIAQQMHKNYFLHNILENVLNREINEDLEDPIFSDDKKEE